MIQLSINFPNSEKFHISLLHFHPHLSQNLLLETLGIREKYRNSCAEVFYKSSCSKTCLKNSQGNTCEEDLFRGRD